MFISSMARCASLSWSNGRFRDQSRPAARSASSSARSVTPSATDNSSRSASENPDTGTPTRLRRHFPDPLDCGRAARRQSDNANLAGAGGRRYRRPPARTNVRDAHERRARAVTRATRFVGEHPEADDVVARGERRELGFGDGHRRATIISSLNPPSQSTASRLETSGLRLRRCYIETEAPNSSPSPTANANADPTQHADGDGSRGAAVVERLPDGDHHRQSIQTR